MTWLFRVIVLQFCFVFVSAWFLNINGVYKDEKPLGAFEIFRIAFTPARCAEIADISIGWPLPHHLKIELEAYLKMVPLDEAGCLNLWKSWRQAFDEWFAQQDEPLADVYGGVTPDWTDFRWKYYDFMKMLLKCYPPDCIDFDIDVMMSRLSEHWPRRRPDIMGLHSDVALALAYGFLNLFILSFLVHIFNTLQL